MIKVHIDYDTIYYLQRQLFIGNYHYHNKSLYIYYDYLYDRIQCDLSTIGSLKSKQVHIYIKSNTNKHIRYTEKYLRASLDTLGNKPLLNSTLHLSLYERQDNWIPEGLDTHLISLISNTSHFCRCSKFSVKEMTRFMDIPNCLHCFMYLQCLGEGLDVTI